MQNSNISVANSIGTSGVAGAIVGIVLWLLSLVHINVPGDVAAEFGVVTLALIHYIRNPKILFTSGADGAIVPVSTTEKA